MPMFVHILLSYFNVIGLFDTGPDTPTSPPTLQSWGVIGCKTTSSLGTFASQTPQKRGGSLNSLPPKAAVWWGVVGSHVTVEALSTKDREPDRCHVTYCRQPGSAKPNSSIKKTTIPGVSYLCMILHSV